MYTDYDEMPDLDHPTTNTTQRARLAQIRIPQVIGAIRRGDRGKFRVCKDLPEVLWRELRAFHRSKRPFRLEPPLAASLPAPRLTLDQTLDRLERFEQLDKRDAFELVCSVLQLTRRPQRRSRESFFNWTE